MLLQLLQCLPGILKALISIHGAMALMLPLSLALAVVIRTGNNFKTRRELKHLRKIGVSTSNMADQYDPQYDAPEGVEIDTPIRIKALYIHPIKSCGAIEVNRALLTKTGFMYDRCFAIATEGPKKGDEAGLEWRFISQRTKPQMSQIQTELWLPHADSNPHDLLVQAGGCVVLTIQDPEPLTWLDRLDTLLHTWSPSAPPQLSFIIPLQPTPAQIHALKIHPETFAIHARDASGLDLSPLPSVAAALPKLKRFLRLPPQQPLKLLRCTPADLTRTNKNLAPLAHIGSPAVHGYTDQQPVNINSLSSVRAVSALLPPENQLLDALRFRANVWITGAPAYAEETWKRCRIAAPKEGKKKKRVPATLSVVCRTARCTMPNVNLATGTFDAEAPAPGRTKGRPQPSATLVQHRTVESGNGAALGYLGMHCVPEDGSLREAEPDGLCVEVGDEVEVLERGVHLFGSTGEDY